MFLIDIDDLPKEISDIPALGYADDFKAISHGEHECETSRGNTEMEQSKPYDLNVSKSKALLIRADLAERDEAGLEDRCHPQRSRSRNVSKSLLQRKLPM